MALEITYFGTYANGDEVYFGSDTLFGYRYDSDTFPSESANDVDEILLEHGHVFKVTQETAALDSLGKTKSISTDYFNAYGLLQDITIKDRQIQDMGLAVAGNRKGFFKEKYDGNYSVEEGNILTDRNGTTWRVIKIIGQRYMSNTEVFRVVVVQNIHLEGS